jgi:hypothetical protein
MRTLWMSRKGARHVELAAQVRVRLAHLRQRRTQILDQAFQHARSLGLVGLHEVLYVRERVEEEVRLDLRLHEGELRLEQILGELVALALGGVVVCLVARMLLAQHEHRHHDAAEADAQAHRDEHSEEALGEHLADVAALHEARHDRAHEGADDDRADLHHFPGHAPLADVARHGEEHHAGVAHAKGAYQQVAVGVEEEPDHRGRGRRANRGHHEHALDGQSLE